MECPICGHHFNELASPVCPSCGTVHARRARATRQAVSQQAPQSVSQGRANTSAARRSSDTRGPAIAASATTEDERLTGPALARKMVRQARAAARQGNHVLVEQLARTGLHADPNNAELFGILGTALLEQDRFDDAMWAYERARDLAPTDPHLRYWFERLRYRRELRSRQQREQERREQLEREALIRERHLAGSEDEQTEQLVRRLARTEELGVTLPPLRARWLRILSTYAVGFLVAVGIALLFCTLEILVYRFYVVLPCVLGAAIGAYLRLVTTDPYHPVFHPFGRTVCGVVLVITGYVSSLYFPSLLEDVHLRGSKVISQEVLSALRQTRVSFESLESSNLEAEQIPATGTLSGATVTSASPTRAATSEALSFREYLRQRAREPLDFYRLRLEGGAFWIVTGLELLLALAVSVRMSMVR